MAAGIGAPNLRFGTSGYSNYTSNRTTFQCHPDGETEAAIIFSLCAAGISANVALMTLIVCNKQLRRWSQGLLFHQAMVDCARAAILIPLGLSILRCEPMRKCSLVETAFLLLVTVSTVNMLTTVLNDSPVFPEADSGGGAGAGEDPDSDWAMGSGPILMDSPQCVFFGAFMIWFASITINLGPTFLSGALAANTDGGHNSPSCPLVHGPFRHYVLNVLWILINLICVMLTLFHLHKLHRDLTKANCEAVRVAGLLTTLVSVTGGGGGGFRGPHHPPGTNSNGTARPGVKAVEEHRRMRNYLRRIEQEGVQRVKMFLVITGAYLLFWGPLFFVTLVDHPLIGTPAGHEVTLHIAYVHSFVNPTLFLVLHRGLRTALLELCCGCFFQAGGWLLGPEPEDVEATVPPPPLPPLPLPLATPTHAQLKYQPSSATPSPSPPPAPAPPPNHKSPHRSHPSLRNADLTLGVDPWGQETTGGCSQRLSGNIVRPTNSDEDETVVTCIHFPGAPLQ
ncbi:unnamed protein product [Bemisia tabaci]|uniref:G-protein coupled receptors family 1 profile domain-containing protein n=1 Tax=Bemisia tabaci TaxID=7038 RepID=A0A9P0CDD8_BEMTA|nr:unnamed protein product [Bemisia tabaci]